MKFKDRIKELRRVKASELVPNPKNWRTHPKSQQDALKGVLSEVGMADACLARELPDGRLMLIDGHLRAETAADTKIPVLVLNVTEAEADKLLATLDPLAGMAESDPVILEALLAQVETENQALLDLISDTAEAAGLYKELSTGPKEEYEEKAAPASGVRMVQLFLDDTNIEQFQADCRALSEAYGTGNITDTILEVVRRGRLSL